MNILRFIIYFFLLSTPFLGYSQTAFYNLGKSYAEDGNYDEAIRLTHQSIVLDCNNTDKYNLLLDYNALCEYFSYKNQSDSCQLYAKKTIDLWADVEGVEYSDILRNLSHHLHRVGLNHQAIEYRNELVEIVKERYGVTSPRLISEYRILSSFSRELEDKTNAIEYAKKEENLAYSTRFSEDTYEGKITFEESFSWLRLILQDYEDPIAGIHYLLKCLNDHRDAIDKENQDHTLNTIWAVIDDNKLVDAITGLSIAFCDEVAPAVPKDLAENILSASPTTAEVFIQSRVWKLFENNEYEKAIYTASKVLSLRESIYGKASDEYLEWLGVMSYQAFNHNQIDDMVKFCEKECTLVKDYYGLQSTYYENAISSIRGYAHQLVDGMPDFTTKWVLPYYNELHEANILPKYQYEFEILQLEGFLALENLQSADQYAHKLEQWTYSINSNNVPLEDQVRILLKLANHYLHMGDQILSRYNIEKAWELLSEAKENPSITQLVDRHIVERELRMDTLGRARINAEWIIATATPIIEAGVEDDGTIAFFYESRAWAYDRLNEYDNAISDIQNAIRLHPLYSRKKKLGQFYLERKDFDLAEKVFLELYNDPDVPNVGIKSLEADLTSLYWLWGKLDKLRVFLSKDYENMRSDVRNAFAFMDEDEREKYLDKSLLGSTIYFDTYTSYSNGDNQWQYGNQMAYNLALVQKGLLLSTTRDIELILNNAPDSVQVKLNEYEKLRELFGSPVFRESGILREKRIELMRYVVNHPQFLSQLDYTWRDVRNQLNDNEVAIEFINLCGVTPMNLKDATPSLGALVLRNDSEFPIFVKLATDSTVTGLFEFDEEGERLNELLYKGEARKQLYSLIWEPLLPYLNDAQSIFYSPTGIIQDINLDWIGGDDTTIICNNYNLYRLSSTREICTFKSKRQIDDAILYGDIAYSITTSPISAFTKSKYRSTTRAGFMPLTATSTELDSINTALSLRQIPAKDIRKDIATEASFREMSGNSPKIIHIATHGFYYSREALEKEYQYGNFMAFQGMHPKLYHSGLALSGAQDTWYNETGDISKYLDLDSSNDGILLSSEISQLDLRDTDLVVLSACETALGSITSEGVYGLQRAFKLAGVNSLIMSLWKVDDDATQLLMTSFYNNYLNGMSKRDALITAQKKVRETPGFEDPYNWAAFILLDGLN